MPIRLRVALVFALALAIAFALGGWLFISQLSAANLRTTDSALAARLSQVRSDPEGETSPIAAVLPGGPAPGEYIVQVVDGSGRVRRASPHAPQASMLNAAELSQARRHKVILTRTIDDQPLRLFAASLPEGDGLVGIAGVSLAASDGTLRQVTAGLLVGGTAFVILAGIGAYWLARAALAPVERLRREAAELSEDDTGATLRVPGTHDEIAAQAPQQVVHGAGERGALARQRAFVADASHELRTPFAVLHGELELAGRPGRSKEELSAAVASAAEEASRLTRITDDLLLLARGDENKLALQLERTDVTSLLARSADRARVRAEAAGVTCRVEAAAGLTAVVDAGRLRQAVDNLVDNALRFAPPGTEVVICAQIAAGSLLIEVSDSGPGFPAEFLPHAFERFRRPDQGRARSEGGAGLGLAIVHAIVSAHGGTAVAANRPEGGATISLDIPAGIDALAAGAIEHRD